MSPVSLSVPSVLTVPSVPPAPTALLIAKQAARYFSLGQRTLENWRCLGEGPEFVRLGRVIRYRLSSLDAWLQSRTFANTGEADHADRAA